MSAAVGAGAGPTVTDFGPSDHTYLHSDAPGVPAHWAMLLDLADEGPALTLDALRERVGERVGWFDLFRVGVRGGFAREPEIVLADDVVIADHVTESLFADDAGLRRLIESQLEEPLPQPQPYWHITLLTSTRTSRQSILLKVHHSLSDGIAGAAFAGLLADVGADGPREFDRFATSPRFRVGTVDPELLAASRTAFERQWAAGDEGRSWPALTGSGRRETALYSASTRELRRAARHHGASVHEFLIAAIGRAVSVAPPVTDEPQAQNIRVTLPVTLDPSFRHTGNAVGLSLLNLPGDSADLDVQIERARAELAITETERLELALAPVDDAPPMPWADQRALVAESMKRMSPDIHIGINPGFTRSRSVLGRDFAGMTPFSPLLGYSFSITGLILGSRTSLGVVADRSALPGYPGTFVDALSAVIAEAAPVG
ncbi:wax ester/triacylglycerol synthase domain-containing protein [Gordonia zhaorongruii]|uniref:wax ester/triacylglycerol synthase domain-containing protein n=1 Tax=Gordonia zhaorongruii TaxID=2597659 RepID=UPI0010460D60|nr:wax ester/triacylglycerol synthase domain-containing protein [Gordonia zhaorongruii]